MSRLRPCAPRREARPSNSPLAAAASLIFLPLITLPEPALAGPPYVTDDPEPTETGHWEDYAFVTGTHTPGATQGQAGVELNYGAATDWQLTAQLPLDYANIAGYRYAAGDLELSAKYRFLHQNDDTAMPDVAFFPAITLPTAGHGFGSGRVSWLLPIWAEKDFGKWSAFGGGGYAINPGAGNRNYWVLGWAVTRTITDGLTLGLEIYHDTPQVTGGRALTDLGVGVVYQLSEHFAFLASGGPGLQNTRTEGQSTFFAALELTY